MGLINIVVIAGGQTGRKVQEEEGAEEYGKRRVLMREER